MTIEENKPNGVWIAQEILVLPYLGWLDKLILAQIYHFEQEGGKCWASNKYFAELFGVSVTHVSKSISHLCNISLIGSKTFLQEGNKRLLKTLFNISSIPSQTIVQGGLEQSYKIKKDKKNIKKAYKKKGCENEFSPASKITSENLEEACNSMKNELPPALDFFDKKQKLILIVPDEKIEEQMKFIEKAKPTEANIQAEFYMVCKQNEINCYLEYHFENCRFDAVLYDDKKEIFAIVEFKTHVKKTEAKTNTRQIAKYSKYNLPILIVNKLDKVLPTVLEALRILWKISSEEKRIEISKRAELLSLKIKDLNNFQKVNSIKKNTLTPLHTSLKEEYKQIYPDYYWEAKDGVALNSIIEKLKFSIKQAGRDPTDDEVYNGFCFIVHNLPDWMKDKAMTTLLTINSQYNAILNHHKNGKKEKRYGRQARGYDPQEFANSVNKKWGKPSDRAN